MMNLLEDCENRTEMTEVESQIFMQCVLRELQGEDVSPDLKNHPCFTGFENLLKERNINCGQWPIMFITFLVQHPAKLMMFAYALYLISKKLDGEIQMQQIVDAFPYGYPSEEEYKMVWESQKDPSCPNSNYLDTEGAWQL